ncbi:hypothetical protein F5878DRAFT_282814 [Lentinula raphanica]|uniref:DUF6534 domain-containing protein n=1 Tax=Lentinula raphanica TaxID=153919 RepID=A0AA38PI91_9AGAR|nr:hypothetical protein F5878DRAFT_282814 [Lentinula raphanica]
MSAQAIPTTVQIPIALDLSASYGALIIAAYISCALWGINVIQTYIYYWKIVDTAHKVLITKVPWFTLIQNWGRISAILASPQEALHEAWVGSIIIVIVQLYYLRRLAKFASTTRHVHTWYLWLIFIVLVALSVLQVPVTVAYCVFSINKQNIFIPINLDLKRVGLVAAAVVDVVIAVAMIMLLKDTDSVDGPKVRGSKRLSRTMSRLTVIIVNTGLVTAIVAIISLILDETASGTDFYTAIAQYPQCSIYFSAFLANLNARHFINGPGADETVSNIEDIRFASRALETRDDIETGLQSRIILSPIHSDGDVSGSGNTLNVSVVGDAAVISIDVLSSHRHLPPRNTPALMELSTKTEEIGKSSEKCSVDGEHLQIASKMRRTSVEREGAFSVPYLFSRP